MFICECFYYNAVKKVVSICIFCYRLEKTTKSYQEKRDFIMFDKK